MQTVNNTNASAGAGGQLFEPYIDKAEVGRRYVADLEALFDHFSPDEETNLVDHSLVTWAPGVHARLRK